MSIDRLAAKVATVPVNARGRRQYPEELKRELLAAFAESDLTQDEFGERIGVPGANLSNWKRLLPRRPTKRPSSRFKAVAVEPESNGAGLSLKAPGGIVIEGLTVAAAVQLLAALGDGSC